MSMLLCVHVCVYVCVYVYMCEGIYNYLCISVHIKYVTGFAKRVLYMHPIFQL